MIVMVANITFAATANRKEVVLRKISAVHISSTFKELTSRATITLPRNVFTEFDRQNLKKTFAIGNPVTISLGYDGVLHQEFSGYVTSLSADIPITIKCEDEMWRLKQLPVNFSASNTSLANLLKSICPGYSIDALEGVALGSVRFAKTTVAKVLEKLKQDFNLYSYMKGRQLVCGKYYAANSGLPTVNFNIERNIVSNGLTYRSKDDVLIKIKAISILKNGKKIEVEVGDSGGDSLDLTYYNITLKAELEKLVNADYAKRKADGFDGSLTAFGLPVSHHGYKAKVTSTIYPDRNGLYYIEGVDKDFDTSGFRQTIKLGDAA